MLSNHEAVKQKFLKAYWNTSLITTHPEFCRDKVILGELDFNSEIDCSINDPTFCSPPPITVDIESFLFHPQFEVSRLFCDHDLLSEYLCCNETECCGKFNCSGARGSAIEELLNTTTIMPQNRTSYLLFLHLLQSILFALLFVLKVMWLYVLARLNWYSLALPNNLEAASSFALGNSDPSR